MLWCYGVLTCVQKCCKLKCSSEEHYIQDLRYSNFKWILKWFDGLTLSANFHNEWHSDRVVGNVTALNKPNGSVCVCVCVGVVSVYLCDAFYTFLLRSLAFFIKHDWNTKNTFKSSHVNRDWWFRHTRKTVRFHLYYIRDGIRKWMKFL